ncbi:hypothetical protein EV141_0944 [Microcella putealis]|uniref:DUF3040 family protein n=1 Tax=Microcella putealis TaxID=337005 RepID=A0A4Q7LYE7_9MICO|nr:hypothetical protein [Microcella putealis]RZS59711.1 hypothetical protein EV141_0944 [Microcella putealis]TQM26824.1 hypothetical protein BJ957_0240 [Microcella putealis]
MAEGSGAGTALLMALAAALWLFYLVPIWRRRREYLATERNAVRLQQTLRIMAQTTELPEAVRAEMTAREVAAQQRSLAARQREEAAIARAKEVAAQRAVRARLAAEVPGLVAEVDAARAGQRRLRQSRAISSLVTLLALVGIVVSAVAGAVAWTAFSAVVALSGVVLLAGLARAGRRRSAVAGAAPRQRSGSAFVDLAPQADKGRAPRAWTPVPLPKPLYLDTAVDAAPRPELRRSAIDHAAVLAAAAAEAEKAQRAAAGLPAAGAGVGAVGAASAPTETPAPRPVATPVEPAAEAPSRFARMGLVDGLPTRAPDLDEVLERRRAAG